MKTRWIVFALLLACSVQAGIIYNDYSASPVKVDTGLSSSTTETIKYLYINSSGDVSTSNPAGLDVHFTAYRDRDAGLFNITTDIETYVNAGSGIMNNFLNEGASIGSGRVYTGGNLLYNNVSGNPGDNLWTAGTGKYLGFRVSDGAGDYFYGWVEVYAEIQTQQASPSLDRAMVQISRVAISDVSGEFIQAGQTVPEPASVLMLLFGGGLIACKRRFFSQV